MTVRVLPARKLPENSLRIYVLMIQRGKETISVITLVGFNAKIFFFKNYELAL